MKKIIITGTTSGIGQATARALATEEYHLIFGVRNIQKAQKLANELGGTKVDIHHVDLSSLSSIKKFSDKMHNTYDSIDILINNAGVFADKKAYTNDGFEMTLGVNFIGTYYLTNLLLDLVEKSSQPQIINIGSRAGMFGKFKLCDGAFIKQKPGFPAYSASKYLQLMATRYLAEHNKTNVKINTVHPGDAATNIWNGDSLLMKIVGPIMKRKLSTPEQAAQAGLYLVNNPPNSSGRFYEKQGEEIEFTKYDKDFAKMIVTETNRLINEKVKF